MSRLSARAQRILLTIACSAALIALALMVWSVVDPRPAPVVIAMSLGQGLGTLSLLAYLLVVIDDLRRAKVILGDDDEGGGEKK